MFLQFSKFGEGTSLIRWADKRVCNRDETVKTKKMQRGKHVWEVFLPYESFKLMVRLPWRRRARAKEWPWRSCAPMCTGYGVTGCCLLPAQLRSDFTRRLRRVEAVRTVSNRRFCACEGSLCAI